MFKVEALAAASIRASLASLGAGIAALVLLLAPITAQAIPIRGLEYSAGLASFADTASLTAGTNTNNVDASLATGAPDTTEGGPFSDVSLGTGGTLILEFTDNLLIDGAGFDLSIYEVGSAAFEGRAEGVFVSLSNDGLIWITDPTVWVASSVTSGFRDPVLIDIGSFAGVNSGDTFSYVRLVDYTGDLDSTGGLTFGADIDAVGAINSVVPEPSTALLIGAGLFGLSARRRRLR